MRRFPLAALAFLGLCAASFPGSPALAADESLLWRALPSVDDVTGMDGSVFFQDVIDLIKVNPHTYVPVFYSFTSLPKRGDAFGSGWSLPLLEANIVQVDENQFRITLPDGRATSVKRDAKDPKRLTGCLANGTMNANSVNVEVCQWKFVYTRGLISGMTAPDGSVMTISRSADGSAEVRHGTESLLKAVVSPETGRLKSITVNDRTYEMAHTKRPNIGDVNGEKVVLGMEYSLGRISKDQKTLKTFSYVKENDFPGLTPQLGINGRVLEWEPLSGLLIRDGNCKVDVKIGDPPAIEVKRTGADGVVTWIKRDDLRGLYETRDRFGSVSHWRVHSSGLLAGALRDTKVTGAGGAQSEERYLYDENASLLAIKKEIAK